MLVARRTVLRQAVVLSDVVTLIAAFFVSYWIRGPAAHGAIGPVTKYLWLLWMIVPEWLLGLWAAGLYKSMNYRHTITLVSSVVRAQLVAALLLLSSMYLTKSVEVSRVLTQIFIAVSFFLFLVHKLTLRAVLERHRHRLSMRNHRALLVGSVQDVIRYIEVVDHHASMVAKVVGVLTPDDEIGLALPNPPIVGRPSDLPRILASTVVDEIVVLTRLWPAIMERMAAACAVRGVVMRLMVDVPSASIGAWHAEDCGGGIFFLSLTAVPEDVARLAIKRGLDVVGAIIGLAVCAVAWLLYGSRLKRETGASALFHQNRVGQNGRRFTLHKFRTMYSDAEDQLDGLREQNKMQGPMFKLEHDPRVTATGQQLRKRHLDELPQFWNVLRGEMSLVGTRPPTEDEVGVYHTHHHRRLSMKPGLTGLWQVKGNHSVSDFEEVVKLDCEYIEHWSLRRDFQILLGTIKKLIRADAW